MFSKQVRHSQGYVTVGMLHADTFPCLTLKAFNGRLIVIFLDLCLRTYIQNTRGGGMDPSMETINASAACQAICFWFDCVERAGRYLTQEQANRIYHHGLTFLCAYQRLGVDSVLAGTKRWKYLPKLHIFKHLNEDMISDLLNCRHFHCFRDEDHIGLLKRLAVKVHKGPLFEFRILTRWLLRLDTWVPSGTKGQAVQEC